MLQSLQDIAGLAAATLRAVAAYSAYATFLFLCLSTLCALLTGATALACFAESNQFFCVSVSSASQVLSLALCTPT